MAVPGATRGTAAVLPLVPAWRVDRTFDYEVPDALAGRVVRGSLVRVPFGGRNVRGIVLEVGADGGAGELEQVLDVVVPVPLAARAIVDLFDWLARRYVVPRGKAFARLVPPRVRVKVGDPPALAPRAETVGVLGTYDGGARLLERLRAGASGGWCIQRLPGDHAAEVVAELIDAAGGGTVLVAVPEVAYGSTVLDYLARAFPQLVRVDSAVPDGERARGWLEAAAGHPLIAGGRSALLAPCPRLRLVVVDEEHHPSYKEDRSPRYDARRVARERARLQRAACVFISPTPSVDVAGVLREEEGRWIAAPRAARRARRPVVELFDKPADRAIGHSLHERIRDTLRSGARAALLVPGRGYARAVWCSECRRSLRCPVCEAGLSSEGTRILRCPRCARRQPLPTRCPSCGSAAEAFRYVGVGSERLAEQVAKAFPRARVRRMDPAVLADQGAQPGGDADIYVTTWIGTKPALRPQVSLVGVVDADAVIRRPDFRAAEAAFQALAEMAEWAGPAEEGGRLAIQTAEPGHHAVQAVVRADYSFFLERELAQRRELGYPPFAELVKVTCSGQAEGDVLREVAEAAREEGARVLGPVHVRDATAPSPARDGRRALQLLLKCPDATAVAERLRVILPMVPAGIRVRVDVDPR